MERPGGALAARPLHFIWIVDASSSMAGKKIETVNFAIREALKPMRDVAEENPNAQILVRALRFSDGARWHVAEPTPIADFKWADIDADGVTDLGKAFELVANALTIENMSRNGLPPVLVLMTDGQPTDDWQKGLRALMAQPWGTKAVRMAIAIGDDCDSGVLQEYLGHPELKPLHAANASDLVAKIKWASTVVVQSASSTRTGTKNQGEQPARGNVPMPAAPAPVAPITADEVF